MEDINVGPVNIKLTNNKDYYTTPEILEQAKIIFNLDYSEYDSDGNKIKRKIKQAIYRALDGKPYHQENGRQRKRMYSRAVVYSLLNTECRHYFLKVKIELEEKKFQKWAESQDKRGKANAEEELKKAREQLQQAVEYNKQVGQIGKEYRDAIEASMEEQTQDSDDHEKPILLRIEEAKKKIFFQYLFESLIDFDVGKYKRDLQDAPDPFDMRPSDLEAAAARRLLDLHNYYTGRINLATVLNRLCQEPPTDTKTNKG